MSLDICVPRHLRTAYTVTVYALLVSIGCRNTLMVFHVLLFLACELLICYTTLQGLWEGFQSHGERLFSILLSFNVEKYTVTTKLVEILFQVIPFFKYLND